MDLRITFEPLVELIELTLNDYLWQIRRPSNLFSPRIDPTFLWG